MKILKKRIIKNTRYMLKSLFNRLMKHMAIQIQNQVSLKKSWDIFFLKWKNAILLNLKTKGIKEWCFPRKVSMLPKQLKTRMMTMTYKDSKWSSILTKRNICIMLWRILKANGSPGTPVLANLVLVLLFHGLQCCQ